MAFSFRPVDGRFFELLTDLANQLEVGADLLAQVLSDQADRKGIAASLSKAET